MSDIFSDKEGGLEAPTRHPVNWKEDSFWDKEDFLKESEKSIRCLSHMQTMCKFV